MLFIDGLPTTVIPTEARDQPRPTPKLSLNVGIDQEKKVISVQAYPADGHTWKYSLDGGPLVPVLWEFKVTPGTHTVEGRFVTAGYVPGRVSKTFVIQADVPVAATEPFKPRPPRPKLNPKTSSAVFAATPSHNRGGRVDMGTYALEYRQQPSGHLTYTPRVVVPLTKGMPEPDKFPRFDLPSRDRAVYLSQCHTDDMEAMLDVGWTHIDERMPAHKGEYFLPNTSRANRHPARGGKSIPASRRASLMGSASPGTVTDQTFSERNGRVPTESQLNNLKDQAWNWGLADYYEDRNPAQILILDWEFGPASGVSRSKFFGVWDEVARSFAERNRREGRKRIIIQVGQMDAPQRSFSGYSEITGYLITLPTLPNGQVANFCDHPEIWNKDWATWAGWLPQLLGRSETWADANRNNDQVGITALMSANERASVNNCPDKGIADNYLHYKHRPDIAENMGLWTLLGMRKLPGRTGGYLLWQAPQLGEPLTTEELDMAGNARLSLFNRIRNRTDYVHVAPEVSYDGGRTWLPPATLQHNDFPPREAYSAKIVRGGVPVREDVVRALYTPDGDVAVFAQNPDPNVPRHNLHIRIGKFVDQITVYPGELYAGQARQVIGLPKR
ncbi:MAG: glycoside hydrolase [Cytophagaceae bacterium]|nr:glycoside hydrolase [Cytophagaceae bacterium]